MITERGDRVKRKEKWWTLFVIHVAFHAYWRVVLAVRWNRSRLCRDHAPHGALVSTLGPEAGATAYTAWTPRFRHPQPRIAPACTSAGDLRP